MNYLKKATDLYKLGQRSKYVDAFYTKQREEALNEKNSLKMQQIQALEKEKTIQLFAMSLEACHLLGLPEESFYDLYFKGKETSPANLFRGMHSEGIQKIIEFFGYSVEIVRNTESVCQLRYTLDEGKEANYTLTLEEATQSPFIQGELLDEESLWNLDPKSMLLHEAMKFIAKTSYRRLFKAKAPIGEGWADNETLANEIFDAEIFDIQIEDYDYKNVLAKYKDHPQELYVFVSHLRERCINRIVYSLNICDALGLPKNRFYDIGLMSKFPKRNPLLNIRGACLIDVMRELGHVIQIVEATSRSCTLKFEKDGIERIEQVVLDTVKNNKPTVAAALETPESAWAQQTTTMLLYEALQKAIKNAFSDSPPKRHEITREEERHLFSQAKNQTIMKAPKLENKPTPLGDGGFILPLTQLNALRKVCKQ